MNIRAARTEFHPPPAARVAHLHHARVNADAEPKFRFSSKPPNRPPRRAAIPTSAAPRGGPARHDRPGPSAVPHRRQAVAVIVDHEAVLLHHFRRQAIHHVTQQLVRLASAECRRQLRRSSEVGKQQRDLARCSPNVRERSGTAIRCRQTQQRRSKRQPQDAKSNSRKTSGHRGQCLPNDVMNARELYLYSRE